jgi:hypothetical protein
MDQSLRRRVALLERENRIFRIMGISVLLASIGASLIGAKAEDAPKPIRASSLEIVDEAGNSRVVLQAIAGIPQVSLTGPDEKRLLLAVDSRPHISLLDQKREAAVHVTLMKDYSTLSLDSKNGSLVLNTFDNGEPNLVLTDKKGRTVWQAGKLQK